MTVYYILYSLIPIIYFISSFFREKNKIFLVGSGILLFIISGFRNFNIGTDTLAYEQVFNITSNFSFSFAQIKEISNMETGYLFFNRIIGFLHGDFRTLVIIISAITVFGFLYFMYKYSENTLMSVILFIGLTYYFISFNISRQFFATAICFLALCFLIDSKFSVTLILVLLGITIHTSVLIFLPLIFLVKFGQSREIFIATAIVGAISTLFLPRLINDVFSDNDKYSIYVNSDSGRSLFSVVFLVLLIILLFLMLYTFNFKGAKNVDYFMLYSLFFICLVDFMIIVNPAISRLKYVLEPMIVVVLPYVINKFKSRLIMPMANVLFWVVGVVIISYLIPNNIFYGITPYMFM